MAREFWRRENSAHWLEFWMGIWEGDAAAECSAGAEARASLPTFTFRGSCLASLLNLLASSSSIVCLLYMGFTQSLDKNHSSHLPTSLPLSFLLHPNSLLFPANSHLSSFIHIGFSTQSCNIFVHYEFHEETLLLLCSLSNPSICV